MADGVFNIAKGAFIEKFQDVNSKGIFLLLTAAEVDATLADYDNLSTLLGAAGNTEASDPSYARKTGITATITVDDVNERVDLDIPDQVFTALAGAAIVKAVFAYEETAADTGRIPMAYFDASVIPDGTDVTFQVNAAGLMRAS